ncbi:MAG: hypothetical protein WBP65_20475 [Candidatus Sulfotelmatobacter sp.]|jgi:hypothetical protein
MARIAPNLDGVAREKAAFDGWQSMKKQATESMSEAVELCLKWPGPEPAHPSLADAATVGAAPRPV